MAEEKMTLVDRLNNPAREQDGSLSERVTRDMQEAAQVIAGMTPPPRLACNAAIPDSNNLCTRDAGHPGGHRCLAIDVDNRNRGGAS